ncbi:MAG: hypothetical protein UX81_C0037G0010 [Parcubacteria group bacterium GW2011_GWA2_47_12]|nr:MAG: hypothetical protein UX81_C0037G0010 [Parcubacteria group bacterium GW2011_GWA2_47_12]
MAFLFAFVAQRLEHTLETGETEVQLFPKAHHALVAQWTVRAGSNGKVAGSNPAEGACIFQGSNPRRFIISPKNGGDYVRERVGRVRVYSRGLWVKHI